MYVQGLSSVEDELRNLSPLHPCAVSAVRGALELKCHFPTLHLCHPFLSKVAQLVPIQNHTGSVEGIRLDLDWILEPNRKGVAGTVREIFTEILSQKYTLTFQLNLGTVLC